MAPKNYLKRTRIPQLCTLVSSSEVRVPSGRLRGIMLQVPELGPPSAPQDLGVAEEARVEAKGDENSSPTMSTRRPSTSSPRNPFCLPVFGRNPKEESAARRYSRNK